MRCYFVSRKLKGKIYKQAHKWIYSMKTLSHLTAHFSVIYYGFIQPMTYHKWIIDWAVLVNLKDLWDKVKKGSWGPANGIFPNLFAYMFLLVMLGNNVPMVFLQP
jgi:hypothetical protein